MDWPSLMVGALVGGIAGIIMQNMLFPSAERRWKQHRQRAFYIKSNKAWSRIERLHPRLILVQAGWDADGCFPDGSIILRLGSRFALNDRAARTFREAHSAEWVAAGLTDGEQIGISAI
ncbi:MAG: hypothetical protein ACRDS0_20195 [Pseudonocardiaceae bacterium]